MGLERVGPATVAPDQVKFYKNPIDKPKCIQCCT